MHTHSLNRATHMHTHTAHAHTHAHTTLRPCYAHAHTQAECVGFKVIDDTTVVISEPASEWHAIVHYFTLCDHQARGQQPYNKPRVAPCAWFR